MCLFVLKHIMFCSCVIVEKAIYSLLCGERPPPLRVWDIDGQNFCSSWTSHPIHPQKPSDTSQLQVVFLQKKFSTEIFTFMHQLCVAESVWPRCMRTKLWWNCWRRINPPIRTTQRFVDFQGWFYCCIFCIEDDGRILMLWRRNLKQSLCCFRIVRKRSLSMLRCSDRSSALLLALVTRCCLTQSLSSLQGKNKRLKNIN